MYNGGAALFVCVTLASIWCGVSALPPGATLPSQQGLARLFFSSRITAQDPLKSMACFADYIAESNYISEKYGTDYNECIVVAGDSRRTVDSEAWKEREAIAASSENVCTRMRTCNTQNSTLDMFNCHANVGSNNTKSTYTISGNASEYATMLQERYRLIELHYEQCCHAAERAYVEITAQNYNHLQACLDGRVEPRPPRETTTSSTTTTTTTTTTTAPTTTSTDAPTTILPSEVPPPNIQDQFAQLLNLLN